MKRGMYKRFTGSISEAIQDGGYLGWFAVLALFSTLLVLLGVTKSLAMMLPLLQEEFDTYAWLVGWMIGMLSGSLDFAAPFASPLRKKFGIRTIVFVSGLVIGFSLIAVSFVSSLVAMAVILCLFTGPAFGFAFTASKEMVGCCFKASITTAFAVAGLGSSLSFIIYPPLTQFFLDIYGWRGTTLLFGALSLHLAVCGALLQPQATSRHDYRTVTVDEDQGDVQDGEAPTRNQGPCSYLTSVCASITRTFSLALFTSIPYWLVTFIYVVLLTMFTAWLVYFVPSTNVSKGFPLIDATNFVVLFGIGKIVGTLCVSPIVSNFGAIGSYIWMGISMSVISTNYFVDPWLMTYWPNAVNMFIFGFFDSFAFTLIDVITKDTVGVEEFGNALGWILLKSGIIRLLFLYFPGLIYDTLGSYTLAFILIGGLNALSVVAVLALFVAKTTPLKPSQAKTTPLKPS